MANKKTKARKAPSEWELAVSDYEWPCDICGKPIKPGTEFYINGNQDIGHHQSCHAKGEAEHIDETVAAQVTFGLEHDLQTALRENIQQIEKGLKITDEGKEQKVESGFIDITAQDRKGNTVVIELKAGAAHRDAVAQILSYMGDVSQAAKPARGILIAGDFPDRTISAARAVPNLQLQKYGFNFTFQRIDKEKK